jgi:hypothetical protein
MLRERPMWRGPGKAAVTAVLALAVALGTVIADPVAAAGREDTVGVDTFDVFGEPLESFLDHYPNARRAADGSYELAPGFRLVPPTPTRNVRVTESPSGCPGEHFCVYQHDNFDGWELHWHSSSCYWVTLDSDHRNRVSSMHNTQNSYTAYWADTGPNPDVRGALRPNAYLRDLKKDTAPDGGHWGDRIDAIDPTSRC